MGTFELTVLLLLVFFVSGSSLGQSLRSTDGLKWCIRRRRWSGSPRSVLTCFNLFKREDGEADLRLVPPTSSPSQILNIPVLTTEQNPKGILSLFGTLSFLSLSLIFDPLWSVCCKPWVLPTLPSDSPPSLPISTWATSQRPRWVSLSLRSFRKSLR